MRIMIATALMVTLALTAVVALMSGVMAQDYGSSYLLDLKFNGIAENCCVYGIAILKLPDKIPVTAGYTTYPYYAARLPEGEYAITVIAFEDVDHEVNITAEAFKGKIYAGYQRITLSTDLELEIALKDPREFELRSVKIKVVFENGSAATGAQVFGASLGRPTSLPGYMEEQPEFPIYFTLSATDSNGEATVMLPMFPSIVYVTLIEPYQPSVTYTCTCVNETSLCSCPPSKLPEVEESYGGVGLVLPEENYIEIVLYSLENLESIADQYGSFGWMMSGVMGSNGILLPPAFQTSEMFKPTSQNTSTSEASGETLTSSTAGTPLTTTSHEIKVDNEVQPVSFMTTMLLGASGVIVLLVVIVVILAKRR